MVGNHTAGLGGDGGPATNAELHFPFTVTLDSANNLYIADLSNNRIREVSANTGIITTLAGNGKQGSIGDNQVAAKAEFYAPTGVALDSFGNVAIVDSFNNRIRELNVLNSALYFAPTPVGLTSIDSPETATVDNIGNAPLVFSIPGSGLNPLLSPGFNLSSSGTCPQLDITSATASLAAGYSCSLLVNFNPPVAGQITGTAVITDNAFGNPPHTQTVQLNGVGLPAGSALPDFTLAITPVNQTVTSANTNVTANYTVTLTSLNSFTGQIDLTATGLPASDTITLTPATVTVLAGGTTTSTMTVVIAATHARSMPMNRFPTGHSAIEYGCLLLPLLGIGVIREKRRTMPRTALLLLIGVLGFTAVTGLSGCKGGGFQLEPTTFTITVTGVGPYNQHSASTTLNINTYAVIK